MDNLLSLLGGIATFFPSISTDQGGNDFQVSTVYQDPTSSLGSSLEPSPKSAETDAQPSQATSDPDVSQLDYSWLNFIQSPDVVYTPSRCMSSASSFPDSTSIASSSATPYHEMNGAYGYGSYYDSDLGLLYPPGSNNVGFTSIYPDPLESQQQIQIMDSHPITYSEYTHVELVSQDDTSSTHLAPLRTSHGPGHRCSRLDTGGNEAIMCYHTISLRSLYALQREAKTEQVAEVGKRRQTSALPKRRKRSTKKRRNGNDAKDPIGQTHCLLCGHSGSRNDLRRHCLNHLYVGSYCPTCGPRSAKDGPWARKDSIKRHIASQEKCTPWAKEKYGPNWKSLFKNEDLPSTHTKAQLKEFSDALIWDHVPGEKPPQAPIYFKTLLRDKDRKEIMTYQGWS